jgi:protein SCO1/2
LPAKLYPLPDAQLLTVAGQPMKLSELRGKVALYDFIFTRCQGPCPLMTREMKKLVGRFDDRDLRFVSISVDPDFDTPPVMRKYAAAQGSDPRWVFLTGDRETIRRLSIDGFKLAAGESTSPSEPIVHSTKFVLVDGEGMVRGYYDAFSEEGRSTLSRDLRAVVAGN